MTHVQMSIQKCIAAIIQQNSLVKNIFDEIYKQGGTILLVGGAVRDCLLGKISSDLDFEVYRLSFDQLQKLLQKFGYVSFIGKSFGVLRLHGLNIDWSIPRKDSTGRKPKVDLDPNMSYQDAFKRRDLTINAMGIDVHTHELIDPYGGLQDLQNKVLRAPDIEFFVHDPLRLFRVMQFIARFEMEPNDELNNVCKIMDISKVSSERIDAEFTKLFLKSKKPSLGLRWLLKIDRFDELFGDLDVPEDIFHALDCLAMQNIDNTQKLFCMWGLVAFSHKNVHKMIDCNQPLSKDLSILLKKFLKKYVHASEVIYNAVMIAWYVRYIQELVKKSDSVHYKLLAYWIHPTINLQLLSTVGTCLYDSDIIEQFRKKSQSAGVLYESEQPLLQGKDLLEYAQGKELGDLVKRAYQIQLQENIVDKDILKKKVVKVHK